MSFTPLFDIWFGFFCFFEKEMPYGVLPFVCIFLAGNEKTREMPEALLFFPLIS